MSMSPASSTSTVNRDGKDRASSIGFWHPEMAAKRNGVILRWLRMTLFLGVAVLMLLSLYWGSLYHLLDRYSSLTVIVVDFDGKTAPYLDVEPIVGPSIVQTIEEQIKQPGPHLGYRFMNPSDFSNDPLEVRRTIYKQHHWAAIIINANATALLKQALETGNKTYDPLGAGQIVFVEARQEAIVDEYILPELQMMQNEVTGSFGSKWISEVAKNMSDSSVRKNIAMAPQVLNPAIGFTTYNLRPFDIPVATPSTSVGLIYLVIFSFFAFPFFLPVHGAFLAPAEHRPLKFANFIVWRILASITTFCFLSLCYSLVSLAFGVPFSRPPGSQTDVAHASAYGRGSFMVYWMLNWVGMTSFGLPSENMCMLLGPPWFSLWLIFWVICNVCVSFYFVPLSPSFYKYGYAWPMHNIVEASRTIIFDVHSRIGLNFGVLFVWCAVSIVLFPFCAEVARRRVVKTKKMEAEEAERKQGERGSEKVV